MNASETTTSRPTNYIHRLQAELAESEQKRQAMEDAARDLRSYLQSNKFWDDTTVQAGDVLSRLEHIFRANI